VSPLIRLLAAVAAAALLIAGCSDDDDSNGQTTAESEEPRVVVETANGGFDPAAVYERASRGVVTISSIFEASDDEEDLFGGGRGAGQGSGFVIGDDGEIVTNAHVVTNAEAAGTAEDLDAANEVFVQFPDRNQVPAEVVGFDPFADVALLKVEPDGLDLNALELGSTEEIAVGDPVAAIGSPFGRDQSLSTGVISATDRSIPSLTEFQIDGAIQTDASINPGNSGGPLLDAEGRVLGINQQINTTSGGNEGVGFAVPIDLARRSVDQLREDGEVEYAYIGVTSQSLYPQLAERLELDVETGALVSVVQEDSPAEEAGVRGSDQTVRFQGREIEAGGDVIVAVNGEEIVGDSDLPRSIALLDPGDEITLEIIRDGEREEVELTLGARPDSVE
jgi:S1-C subfamily serine protease